eukprot:CAMPEP_0179299622 /NCGR_PEP_ID=MMETSP0797-20121207/46611_1 /TAXON_ID=47934 /ORGANISM="Dinophysis acuminata, Strain DAEP01" /LENGTH=181 /DNA_ID=CAMNT_0021009061 /DNA_START=18 /DNA_END=560 /DNA_ORIENTATION=-
MQESVEPHDLQLGLGVPRAAGAVPLVVLEVLPDGLRVGDVVAARDGDDRAGGDLVLPERVVLPVEVVHERVGREELPEAEVRGRRHEEVGRPAVEHLVRDVRLAQQEAHGVQEDGLGHDVPLPAQDPAEHHCAVGVRDEAGAAVAVCRQHRPDGKQTSSPPAAAPLGHGARDDLGQEHHEA